MCVWKYTVSNSFDVSTTHENLAEVYRAEYTTDQGKGSRSTTADIKLLSVPSIIYSALRVYI